MTIGSWNGTASSDNFPNILCTSAPPGFGGFRVAHVHTFHSFMRAVLTFRLGHVMLPWSMNLLIASPRQICGFTLEKYSTLHLYSLGIATFLRTPPYHSWCSGDCFAFATRARSLVAITLNSYQKPGRYSWRRYRKVPDFVDTSDTNVFAYRT